MSPDLLEIVTRIVERAGPDEQVEAYAASGTQVSVRVHGGEIESLTQAGSAGVGIRVVTDGRSGFAWAGSLDHDIVNDTLRDARDNARFAEPDEHAGLAQPDGVAPPDLDLWHDDLDHTDLDQRAAVALELEKATTGRDPRVTRVHTASYGDARGQAAIASTTGVRARGRSTRAHLAVSALADAGGDTFTGTGVSIGRSPSELSVDEAADDAVERATRLVGAAKPPSSRVTLVLEPRMSAALLGIVAGMLNGESVLKGRTPFAERVGDEIAARGLTLVSDATDPRSLAADVHDGEGLATRRVPLITDGRLAGFTHNSYTARRSGTASTASAVRGYRSTPSVGAPALAVTPGTGGLEELVAGVDHGLLVQTMKGLHSGVNPISGDFSVGIEGVLIRDGVRAEPVKEATIASTIQRMLLDLEAIGADLEWTPGGTGGVTLVVPDVSLSGA